MVLKEEENDDDYGVNLMDCDSSEEIAGERWQLRQAATWSGSDGHMQVVSAVALQAGGQPAPKLHACPAYASCMQQLGHPP
jgi:hypothetical protein